MGDFWEGFRPLLDTLNVQSWMYPLFIAFGVSHQYACAYLSWWTRGCSFASAVLLASVFGGLSCGEHGLTSLECGIRVVTLLAGALLAEGAANRIPGIPKYNAKVNAKEGDA